MHIGFFWRFQDFRHVHSPATTMNGASKESLSGHSAGSMRNVEYSSLGDRTSDKLESDESSTSCNNAEDGDDGNEDKSEDKSDYDDDRWNTNVV